DADPSGCGDRVSGGADASYKTTETVYAKFTPDYVVGATAALEGLGDGKNQRSQRMRPRCPNRQRLVYRKCAWGFTPRASLNSQGRGLEIRLGPSPFGVRIPGPPPISMTRHLHGG